MFGEKAQRITELEAENARLHGEMASLNGLLPLALALQQEIADAIDPYVNNPRGYGPDVVSEAYAYLRDAWIEDARMRAYREIAKRDGSELMSQMIKEIYATDRDALYATARGALLNNPERLERLQERAASKALARAKLVVIKDMRAEIAVQATEEASRIGELRSGMKKAEQSGRIALCDLSGFFRPLDQVHIGVTDPDHKGIFGKVTFIRPNSPANGWLYGGFEKEKGIGSGSGANDKAVPRNIVLEPMSLINNPANGEIIPDAAIVYGGQLAVRLADGKTVHRFRTREISGSNYYTDTYDYDPATISNITFVPRPVLSWVSYQKLK